MKSSSGSVQAFHALMMASFADLISDAIVNVFASSVGHPGFAHRSSQTRYYQLVFTTSPLRTQH